MMIIIGGWLLCGLIAAFIGEGKGHGCAALIIGSVLGPIGLLIVILMPGEECPYCRGSVRPGATVCPHCQRAIAPG